MYARLVGQRDLVGRRVPAFDVHERMKQIWVLAQRARDRTQSPDVLRVTPPRVVASAVRVRDVGDGHRAPRRRRDVHSASSATRATSANRRRVVRVGSPRGATRASNRAGGPSASTSDASGVSSTSVELGPRSVQGSIRDRRNQARPPFTMRRRGIIATGHTPTPRLIVTHLHNAAGIDASRGNRHDAVARLQRDRIRAWSDVTGKTPRPVRGARARDRAGNASQATSDAAWRNRRYRAERRRASGENHAASGSRITSDFPSGRRHRAIEHDDGGIPRRVDRAQWTLRDIDVSARPLTRDATLPATLLQRGDRELRFPTGRAKLPALDAGERNREARWTQ